MTSIRRLITWFDPDTGEFVGEAELTNIPLRELQELFGEPADHPMMDCYRVTAAHISALQPHLDHQIRLDRYSYFVEAEAAPVPHLSTSTD